MKKKSFLIIFLSVLSIVVLKAQTGQPINIGTIDTINSKILGEKRTVWVYVPAKNNDDKFAKPKYPVVYLLDGDASFTAVKGMIQYLSDDGIIPEMIVVGIVHKDRFKDLTPTATGPGIATNTSGGGEKFLDYTEKELMPYINKTYPTLPYNVFIGHSLGGLLVMQAFMHHYEMFNSYVVLEPSMWWDQQKLLKETSTLLKNTDLNDKPIYLGIANPMRPGMDTANIKKDTTRGTLHTRSILELEQLFKINKKRFSSIYYNNYGHSPASLTGTYDALLWLFRSYNPGLKQTDYLNVDTLKNKLDAHLAKFSNELGAKYEYPERLVNALANTAMTRKQMNSAEYLFRLNITNYPTSFNAFDKIGDFYTVQNNKDKAIEYFKKALSIKDVEATRVKLKQLESK